MDYLSDLAVFVQVVEAGSFTAAADKLGLTQSAVSKAVNRLEERMGTRLLNRSTRRLSVTETGTVLYDRSKPALVEIEEAELEVARLQMEPRGVLRVNAPMSFGILHIAPLLGRFLERYPALTIDLQLDDRVIDLVEDGFDCAIRINAMDNSILVAKQLGPCRQVICATPHYLKTHGIPSTPNELKDHPILIYTHRPTPGEWELRSIDNKIIKIQTQARLHSNNGIVLMNAGLQGLGIMILPTFYIDKQLQEGELVTLMDDYNVVPELNIQAVYPQRRHLSPKVRVFIDFLVEHMRGTTGD